MLESKVGRYFGRERSFRAEEMTNAKAKGRSVPRVFNKQPRRPGGWSRASKVGNDKGRDQRDMPCGALLAFALMSREASGGFRADYQLGLRSTWMLC